MIHSLSSAIEKLNTKYPREILFETIPTIKKFFFGGIHILEFLASLRYLNFYSKRITENQTDGYSKETIKKELFSDDVLNIISIYINNTPTIIYRYLVQNCGSEEDDMFRYKHDLLGCILGKIYGSKISSLNYRFKGTQGNPFFSSSYEKNNERATLALHIGFDHANLAFNFLNNYLLNFPKDCFNFLRRKFLINFNLYEVFKFFLYGENGSDVKCKRYITVINFICNLIIYDDYVDDKSICFTNFLINSDNNHGKGKGILKFLIDILLNVEMGSNWDYSKIKNCFKLIFKRIGNKKFSDIFKNNIFVFHVCEINNINKKEKNIENEKQDANYYHEKAIQCFQNNDFKNASKIFKIENYLITKQNKKLNQDDLNKISRNYSNVSECYLKRNLPGF
jgi:hypothetical protein